MEGGFLDISNCLNSLAAVKGQNDSKQIPKYERFKGPLLLPPTLLERLWVYVRVFGVFLWYKDKVSLWHSHAHAVLPVQEKRYLGPASGPLHSLSGGALTSVPKMCPFWASSSGSLSATDKPLPLHTARTEAGLHGLPHLCLLFSCFSPNWSDSFSRSEAWSIGSQAYYIRPGSSKSPRHKAHDYLLNAKW